MATKQQILVWYHIQSWAWRSRALRTQAFACSVKSYLSSNANAWPGIGSSYSHWSPWCTSSGLHDYAQIGSSDKKDCIVKNTMLPETLYVAEKYNVKEFTKSLTGSLSLGTFLQFLLFVKDPGLLVYSTLSVSRLLKSTFNNLSEQMHSLKSMKSSWPSFCLSMTSKSTRSTFSMPM